MRIAIIGAGAAGCFAAANMPYNSDYEVTIFEKSSRTLQKVKVSGGGRCNVTHACHDIPELLKKYPRGQRFLRKTLYEFTPQHTIDWFAKRGITLKIEDDGRMFPVSDSSQTIIDCLSDELRRNRVQIQFNKSVDHIVKTSGQFQISFKDGSSYVADRVLVACGGFPKEEQYTWIKELGHTIEVPVPSLFTFNIPKHPITELMGVSVADVSVKIQGTKIAERGPVLVTHWGLSGPVVLRCSAWGARQLNELGYDFRIQINWLADKNEQNVLDEFDYLRQNTGKQLVSGKNALGLPKRLWAYLLEQAGIASETKWGELSAKGQNKLIASLVRDEYHVFGKTTFKEEFVTSGGIKLSEVEPKTLESRIVPGLFFAGEILNIDGITGGFNFQHAWSSAYIAANNILTTKQ